MARALECADQEGYGDRDTDETVHRERPPPHRVRQMAPASITRRAMSPSSYLAATAPGHDRA